MEEAFDEESKSLVEKEVKSMDGKLRIPITNKKQLKLVMKAEKMLRKAGVEFDRGYDKENREREWELDWSLKGAWLECRTQ